MFNKAECTLVTKFQNDVHFRSKVEMLIESQCIFASQPS